MPLAVTVIFNILLLFCSILMVLSSVLLILGLQQVSVLLCPLQRNAVGMWPQFRMKLQNKRHLLIPWISFMLGDLLIEVCHLVHLALSRRVKFDPIVGFIFTMDFFLLCLNVSRSNHNFNAQYLNVLLNRNVHYPLPALLSAVRHLAVPDVPLPAGGDATGGLGGIGRYSVNVLCHSQVCLLALPLPT